MRIEADGQRHDPGRRLRARGAAVRLPHPGNSPPRRRRADPDRCRRAARIQRIRQAGADQRGQPLERVVLHRARPAARSPRRAAPAWLRQPRPRRWRRQQGTDVLRNAGISAASRCTGGKPPGCRKSVQPVGRGAKEWLSCRKPPMAMRRGMTGTYGVGREASKPRNDENSPSPCGLGPQSGPRWGKGRAIHPDVAPGRTTPPPRHDAVRCVGGRCPMQTCG